MDRFTATGLALEATTHEKTIVVVSSSRQEANIAMKTFRSLAPELLDTMTFRFTNGQERIGFAESDAKIVFRPTDRGIRGITADVVYVEADVVRHHFTQDQAVRWLKELRVAVAVTGGDVYVGG